MYWPPNRCTLIFSTFFWLLAIHMDPKLKEAIQTQKPALDDGKSAGLPLCQPSDGKKRFKSMVSCSFPHQSENFSTFAQVLISASLANLLYQVGAGVFFNRSSPIFSAPGKPLHGCFLWRPLLKASKGFGNKPSYIYIILFFRYKHVFSSINRAILLIFRE